MVGVLWWFSVESFQLFCMFAIFHNKMLGDNCACRKQGIKMVFVYNGWSTNRACQCASETHAGVKGKLSEEACMRSAVRPRQDAWAGRGAAS